MSLSLVITTYQRPDALAAVLATVGRQTSPPDELIVADDGSTDETPEIVARFAAAAACPVRYVRQDHLGFRLTRLRNLATAHARGDYLVFCDGDMLLHAAFVADHRRFARRGHYTQGVRIHLDAAATAHALASPGWTPGLGTPGLGGLRRLYGLHAPRLSGAVRRLANPLVAIKGCNQGFWKADLVAVNGFDEDIVGWGPEDKELCARLEHRGVRRQTLLFGGIAWHLHHPPASRERRAANERILARTLTERRVRCAHGLDAHTQRPGML